VTAWRRRSLAGKRYPYLIIYAHYEQLRREGSVRSNAVLWVAGIDEDGYREHLGLWTGSAESRKLGAPMFRDLVDRGVAGVEMTVSYEHLRLVQVGKDFVVITQRDEMSVDEAAGYRLDRRQAGLTAGESAGGPCYIVSGSPAGAHRDGDQNDASVGWTPAADGAPFANSRPTGTSATSFAHDGNHHPVGRRSEDRYRRVDPPEARAALYAYFRDAI
jgi:hypothetical protein